MPAGITPFDLQTLGCKRDMESFEALSFMAYYFSLSLEAPIKLSNIWSGISIP